MVDLLVLAAEGAQSGACVQHAIAQACLIKWWRGGASHSTDAHGNVASWCDGLPEGQEALVSKLPLVLVRPQLQVCSREGCI